MTPTAASQRTNSALLHARTTYTARAEAAAAYKDALRDALAAGCSYAQIAATLGISRQAARQAAHRT